MTDQPILLIILGNTTLTGRNIKKRYFDQDADSLRILLSCELRGN